jgi:hypothetical protein
MRSTQRDTPQAATPTLTCRVTPEQKRLVMEAAKQAGCRPSDFVRNAVLEAINAIGAVPKAAPGHDRPSLEKVDRQLDPELGLAAALLDLGAALRRVERLEQDILFASRDFMQAVRALLEGRTWAPFEVARLWVCMSSDDQARMLHAVAAVVLKELHEVGRRAFLQLPDLGNEFELTRSVQFLIETVASDQGAESLAKREWDEVRLALNANVREMGRRLGDQTRRYGQSSPTPDEPTEQPS